jgi:hypothetical protein
MYSLKNRFSGSRNSKQRGFILQLTSGDLLDRHSILLLRIEHGEPMAEQEFALYDPEAKKLVSNPLIAELYVHLLNANRSIWDLESAIRKYQDLTLEEVGRRALKIREWNGKRVAAKNAINIIYNQLPDVKISHLSEDRN